MDHMAKYYKNLSEHLFNQRDHLLRLLNEVAPASKKSQSRLVDGVWVDDDGNPVQGAPNPLAPPDLLTPNGPEPISPAEMVGPPSPPSPPDLTPPPGIARPDPNEVPGLIGRGEPGSPGVAPLPQNPNPTFTPQNPGISPASQLPSSGTPAPSDREKEQGDFETARRGYYTKRNQQIRDEAAERIAAIDALGPSNNPRTNAARAVNRLKAQRALKKGNDKFNQADIDRMVKSDSKERFMSQADKDARKERDAQAVAGLTKAGHEKMGHTQNARGEWVDAQGKPASLVGPTVDRFGPDKIIQGTSMTYGEFERQTGRKYNALNKEDSTLVSRLAGAGRYGSEAARQGALSSDAMNQGYQKQNDEMAKETGRLDRQVDASQRELDRFRNDPKYRESQRNLDSKGNPIMTPKLRAQIAAQTEREVRALNAIDKTRKEAELEDEMRGLGLSSNPMEDIERDYRESPRAEFSTPPLKPTQTSNGGMGAPPPAKPTPAGGNSAVGQPQLQTRQASPPPASAPTSVGPPPSSTGTQNRTSATQPTTGGQVTQTAANMTANPVSGNPNQVKPIVASASNTTTLQPTATPARPPAPAAPPVAVGSSVTAKAATMTTKPQLASAGAPIDPQQTGGPTAQNRGIPIPSANPMADAQAGPLGAPLKKKLVASAGRTPNIRA